MRKILVVEDEVLQREVIASKFQKEGFAVSTAKDGEEAIKLLHQGDGGYEAVILDLVLPKKDGFAVLQDMQDNNISTPVVVLSALGQEEDKRRAGEFRVKKYFVKTDTALEEVVGFVEGLLAEGNK